MKTMFLIRGVPGIGKTTFAKNLLEEHVNDIPLWIHIETDQYWFRPDGTYDFNFKYLSNAHEWCYRTVKSKLGMKSVIVSNTFTTHKEMVPYIDLATEFDYKLIVIRCGTEYGSIHSVPETTMEKMRNRFEDYEGEIYVEDYK